MKKKHLLFLIIFIEGYVVLACELLAIRSLIPFVGSGVETISIIISSVLLPLAIGYNYGGTAFQIHYRNAKNKGSIISVRKIICRNISYAILIFSFGLSYPFLDIFFNILRNISINNYLIQTTIYSIFFLVWPVFLLGQTVPLVSNYLSTKYLSQITGKMLFFSTLGSFFGSVFSTIILMTYIGINYTVIVTLSLLFILVIILIIKDKWDASLIRTIFAMMIVFLLNNNNISHALGIISNNQYNLVQLVEEKNPHKDKYLRINHSISSKWSLDSKQMFPYIKYIETNFLQPIQNNKTLHDILIIGAGGFTLGYNDTSNRYTYVDIDKNLKNIAEEHLLPEKLKPNKKFIVSSARAFVHNTKEKYDIIIIDTYTNLLSIPMECITEGFLIDVKSHLKPNGIIIANIIAMPDFSDKFSVRYDNTFRSVFPNYTRQTIGKYNQTQSQFQKSFNIIYVYYNKKTIGDNAIYTDNKNSYSLDR